MGLFHWQCGRVAMNERGKTEMAVGRWLCQLSAGNGCGPAGHECFSEAPSAWSASRSINALTIHGGKAGLPLGRQRVRFQGGPRKRSTMTSDVPGVPPGRHILHVYVAYWGAGKMPAQLVPATHPTAVDGKRLAVASR